MIANFPQSASNLKTPDRGKKDLRKKKMKTVNLSIESTIMCVGDVLPSTLIIIDAGDSPDPLVVHLAGQLPWSRLVEALQPRQFNNNLL